MSIASWSARKFVQCVVGTYIGSLPGVADIDYATTPDGVACTVTVQKHPEYTPEFKRKVREAEGALRMSTYLLMPEFFVDIKEDNVVARSL